MSTVSAKGGATSFAALVLVVLGMAGAALGDAGKEAAVTVGPPATRPSGTMGTMAIGSGAATKSDGKAGVPKPMPAYELIEIGGSNKAGQAREAGATGKTLAPDTSLGLTRVGMALLVVIGAIFGLRWIGRRFFGIASVGDGGVVKVLSRSTIGPRQQVILMQVGKRVLVVANSGAGMNTLCEVSEEEEVVALVAEARRPEIDRGRSFKSLFGRAEASFEGEAREESSGETEEKEAIVPEVATTREEISGLLDKVRNLTRDFRRA